MLLGVTWWVDYCAVGSVLSMWISSLPCVSVLICRLSSSHFLAFSVVLWLQQDQSAHVQVISALLHNITKGKMSRFFQFTLFHVSSHIIIKIDTIYILRQRSHLFLRYYIVIIILLLLYMVIDLLLFITYK